MIISIDADKLLDKFQHPFMMKPQKKKKKTIEMHLNITKAKM